MTTSSPTLVLLLHILFLTSSLLSPLHANPLPSSVDFIIVGAGTAGSVLAARLCTRLPNATFLLLERSKPRNATEEFIVRTARARRLLASEAFLELAFTEPEPTMNNRILNGVTGRTLGGSSSVNGGQFTYPPRGTIPSYGINGLTDARAFHLLHRILRKVPIAPPPRSLISPYTSVYRRAAANAGFRATSNPFDGQDDKASWVLRHAFDHNGMRRDSFSAYVTPILSTACASNLRLVQTANVERVLLHPRREGRSRYVARGVRVRMDDGTIVKVRAKREVLLSAGPYASPRLLQLSGIGPSNVLRAAGVTPRISLPVGRGAQGRIAIVLTSTYSRRPLPAINPPTLYTTDLAANVAQFLRGDRGPFAFTEGSFNVRVGRLGYLVGTTVGEPGQRKISSVCVTSPDKSRATLQIRNADVNAPLKIRLNALSTRREMHAAIQCVREVHKLHDEWQNLMGGEHVAPFNLTKVELENDAIVEAIIRQVGNHAWHFVAGAPTGKVVDGNLRVKHVAGLRVIDASVIPKMPVSAGPLSSVFILAEHMAARIGNTYKQLG